MSAIWVVIVVSVGTFIFIEDTYDNPTEGPWIISRLSAQSKAFYENLEDDESGPAYTVSFNYENGIEQKIRFPLLKKNISEIDFQEKLEGIAKETGNEISSDEIQRFKENVSLKNSQAFNARNEFLAKVEEAKIQNIEKRKEIIYSSLAISTLPPLVVLIIGFGIAWVRRGFQKSA